MPFLKFKPTRLFDGITFRGENSVLVTDENGQIEDIVPASEAGENISDINGILSPGFVNCHCHLELSHMKGLIPPGSGLIDFVLAIIQQRHFPEKQILAAIDEAESEMLTNGIVAVGDICNNTLTIPQKQKGRIFYHNFIEASGFNPAIAKERFERSLSCFNEYAKLYSIPIESNSIVPHAPYSVADELWEHIVSFPGNHLLTIHNQEIAAENEWFVHKSGEFDRLYEKLKIDTGFFKPSGKSSLQTYLPRFLHNQSVILVHNVHTSDEDLLFAASSSNNADIHYCLCPNANQYITGTMPPVDLLLKNNCSLVLGTDSLASNNQLSILSEIKTLHSHFPSVGVEKLLKWATFNGAKALQMDSLLGSFEKGKNPGVVFISDDLQHSRRII